MKKKLIKQSSITLMLLILGIIFFRYDVIIGWDSSEYIFLGSIIGKSNMITNWIGHRGILFPLLMKLADLFGTVSMKLIMFISYFLMIFCVYLIYQEFVKTNFINHVVLRICFWILFIALVILNPIIFGYYHVVLTEFVSMTFMVWGVYLSFKWLESDFKENKKIFIKYVILFSIYGIFLYHIKQSLITFWLANICIVTLLSIIKKFKLYNILSRIISCLIIGIFLVVTILIWNFVMKDAKVAEKTYDARVGSSLIRGTGIQKNITKEYTTEKKGTDKIEFDMNLFFESLKDDFQEIIDNYVLEYKAILNLREGDPIQYFRENWIIGTRIYKAGKTNVIDFNKDYKKYLEKYEVKNISENGLKKYINKGAEIYNRMITIFLKYNFIVIPFMDIALIIFYIILKKKINKNYLSMLEGSIIMYTSSFALVLGYVFFGATVDRYIVPAIIPMIIADILLILNLVKLIIFLYQKYGKIEISLKKKRVNNAK